MIRWPFRRSPSSAARELSALSAQAGRERRSRERQRIVEVALKMRRDLGLPEWTNERTDNG